MNPLLPLFLEEAQELVERGARELVALERASPDARATLLDGVFRTFHTLKGASALFDLAPMTALLHAAEEVLAGVRASRAAGSQPLFDALLLCLDEVQAWLPAVSAAEALPAGAAGRAAHLTRVLEGLGAGTPPSPPPPAGPLAADEAGAADWAATLTPHERAALAARPAGEGEMALAIAYDPDPRCFYRGDDPVGLLRRLPGLVVVRLEPAADFPALGDVEDPFLCWLRLRAVAVGAPAAVAAHFRLAGAQVRVAPLRAAPPDRLDDAAAPALVRMLRVPPERVERMVALAGEAVVARNALQHAMALAEAELDAGAGHTFLPLLKQQAAALDRLVRDWHEAAVRLRLVPAADLFQRLPRVARDASRQLGRDVELVFSGELLEAGRDVLEAMFEPLVHLVRNAIDHGIEAPEARRAAGKPAISVLAIRALRDAGALVIEVEDDGPGLDLAALRRRAAERGLLEHAAAEALPDAAAADLVFMAGLSTAPAVSAISGRGVGMDAVRTAVEAAGGRVAISSEAGRGTRVRLHLPLAASVMRIMTVLAGGVRFGVPLQAVRQMRHVPRARVLGLPRTRTSAGGRAFALGERIVPLASLASLLGLEPACDTPAGAPAAAVQSPLSVLIVDTAEGEAALEIDAAGERFDVILRPLTGLLAALPHYLGTTLLGDGQVLLVLDVQALLQ